MINYSPSLNSELRDFIQDEFPDDEFSSEFRNRARQLFNSAVEETAQRLLLERTQKKLDRLVTKRTKPDNLMQQRVAKISRLI
jgi:hypothetical protein